MNNFTLTTTTTQTRIICPNCKELASAVDHLKDDIKSNAPRTFTWFCDNCGHQYSFDIDDKLNVTNLKLTGIVNEKSITLLRHGKIGLIVKDFAFNRNYDKSFYYNENTCPTNYLKNVEEVVDLEDKSSDPHGIFEYITTIPYVDFNQTTDAYNFFVKILSLKSFENENNE